jgi:alpha-ketoglutarate-dependent taurine dioxygenase
MAIRLYKNVEIGEVPETPATPLTAKDSTLTATESLISYSVGLGYAISYIQEQQGRLVQNIVPVHKTEYEQISTSSKVQLALHTETAFHPYKPDYVMLLCLRGDPTAVTTYADVDEIVSYLDDETITHLQKDWYLTGVDKSFRSNGEDYCEFKLPVLTKVEDGFNLIYDEDLMKPTTLFADAALENLSKAIDKSVKEIVLETGDLLVIDNNKTIHGRKPFQPRYDGTDRWVQRMLVRKQKPPTKEINGHTVITKFEK